MCFLKERIERFLIEFVLFPSYVSFFLKPFIVDSGTCFNDGDEKCAILSLFLEKAFHDDFFSSINVFIYFRHSH